MPDSDKVHSRLAGRYQNSYKQLCEGHYDSPELAHSVLLAVKKDIQSYGNGPIKFIEQVATTILEELPTEPLLRLSIKWPNIRKEISKLMRQYSTGNKRGFSLADDACKQQLEELKQSEFQNQPNFHIEISLKYVRNICMANFVERIPLERHYYNVDQGVLEDRLEDIRPYIESGFDKYAAQMVRSGDVAKLRRPAHTKQPIGLHDDLL